MTEQSLKGTNWGTVVIDDKNLSLKHYNSNVVKFPLKKIINSTIQKNDIIVQLNTDDQQPNEDMLCEIRFYIPPNEQKQKKKLEEQESDEETTLEKIQTQILSKAQLNLSTDSIFTIHDVALIVPRGRYTMDFFKKDMRFHGTTYQFNIDFKHISRFFLMPMPDEVHLSFVIALDTPIKQGQTAYHYVVTQFRKDFESEVQCKYTRQKLDEIGWKGINLEYSGNLYDIVCEILSEITGIKVISPKNFKSRDGFNCIRCSIMPHSGYLYPLEKSFLFIQKPVVHIKHEDIKEIVFQRISQISQNKSFEIKVITKHNSYLFSTISRDEQDLLSQYLVQKKLQVRKLVEEQVEESNIEQIINMDSDEDDEDFQAGEDSYQSVQIQK